MSLYRQVVFNRGYVTPGVCEDFLGGTGKHFKGYAKLKEYIHHFVINIDYSRERGSIVVQALCCKPEGHGFNSRRGNLFVLIYLIPPATLRTGVY
jgi:hypothetical protein